MVEDICVKSRDLLFVISLFSVVIVIAFITLPILRIMTGSSIKTLTETLKDREALNSIWLSVYTSGLAAFISFFLGTPLAYLLSRFNFFGKRFVESIVDLPIVIPHPVIGIAILLVVGKNYWFGDLLYRLGIKLMGSVAGIITVLTFVAIPFYTNMAKEGFDSIPVRLEKVSRSLGASMIETFVHVTFPLAKRSMIVGFIMALARSISEFGAVVIVAYHPMIAPVLIYERFESYGLKYSLPVAFWLVFISLSLFLILRILINEKSRGRV